MNENEFIRKDVYSSDAKYFDKRLDDLKERLEDYKETTSDQNSRLGLMIGVIAFLFAAMQVGIAIVLWFFTSPVK